MSKPAKGLLIRLKVLSTRGYLELEDCSVHLSSDYHCCLISVFYDFFGVLLMGLGITEYMLACSHGFRTYLVATDYIIHNNGETEPWGGFMLSGTKIIQVYK